MVRLKSVVGVFCAVSMSLLLVSCGPKPVNKGYESDVPDEIQRIIDSKYSEAINNVGTGTGPSELIAKDRAILKARGEIARQFKTQLDALQKSYTESVNNKAVEEYTEAMKAFVSISLEGTKEVKAMIRHESDGNYTAKVLVVLAAEQVKALVDQKMQAYTSFKASKAYEELDARVAKEHERAGKSDSQ